MAYLSYVPKGLVRAGAGKGGGGGFAEREVEEGEGVGYERETEQKHNGKVEEQLLDLERSFDLLEQAVRSSSITCEEKPTVRGADIPRRLS